jgi:DNA-binding HxlR family transcriptional regulator
MTPTALLKLPGQIRKLTGLANTRGLILAEILANTERGKSTPQNGLTGHPNWITQTLQALENHEPPLIQRTAGAVRHSYDVALTSEGRELAKKVQKLIRRAGARAR